MTMASKYVSLGFVAFIHLKDRIKSYRMKGPHGNLYKCIPALATYSADLPEQ